MATSVEPSASSSAPAATATTATDPARKLSLIARVKRALKRQPKSGATVTPLYPPSPFAVWDYDDADAAVAKAVDDQTIDVAQRESNSVATSPGEARFPAARRQQDPINVNRRLYQGDHWLDGSGWIGPHPDVTDSVFTNVMTEIANIFTSKNAVKEVVDRHAAGVIGKNFRWSFVPRRTTGDQQPTADEQKAIDAATGLVRDWLTARKVPTLMLDAVATLLLAERSSIRLYTPYGLTQADSQGLRTLSAASISEALSKIWPEHNQPETATVACDADTKLEAGVIRYEGAQDAYDDTDELSDSDAENEETREYAWLCFLNRVGETVIRILSDDDGGEDSASDSSESSAEADPATPHRGDAVLKLGGRLAMFEMRRPALATPQVQQNQRALNYAVTMVPRNITTGGFPERLLLDAAVPGGFQKDAAGNSVFVPSPLKLGSSTTNFIEGAEYKVTNDQGETVVKRGSPSAVFREPVKPDASIAAAAEHYEAILAEVGQRHVLIAGDATTSAVSRVQARAEYLNTLLKTKAEVDAAFTWLIETALAMAEAIAKQPGLYTDMLRVQGSCKLDTGPITPEERKAIEESIGVTISQETAMLMLDVDDVDAEQSRMADDPASKIEWGKELGLALTNLTTAGATLKGAAKLLGLTKEQLDDLLTPEDYAALPGGVSVKQPKPGEPGEVIDPQDALEQPTRAVNAPATDAARVNAAGAPTGTKQGSTSGSAPGGAVSAAASGTAA